MEKRILIARWLGSDAQAIPIYDTSSVSSARQHVRAAGQRLNLSNEVVETAALVASEVTQNQLAHAKQGYLAVRPIVRGGINGIELVAADIGPGITRPTFALSDKSKPAGSLGAGLSAACRLADEIEFDNRVTEGFCVVARKFERSVPARAAEPAIMGRPYPGEIISGDDAVFIHMPSGFLAALSDGLGHGPEAREASHRAIEKVTKHCERHLDRLLTVLNTELAGTRGCAMSIVRFNEGDRMLECLSVGDVHSHLYHLKDAFFFASTPMILGEARSVLQKIRIEKTQVPVSSVLVMFSDGIKSRATLKGQLDVLRRSPIAIAEHLLENDSRPNDDALVLVVRFRS